MYGNPEPFGRYELLERIAVGGMAEIFRARSRSLAGFEKILAIKRLHSRYGEDVDFIKMLIEEARISVRLNHVNIVQIFDLDKIDDHYFIAMEYVDGRDLYRVLRRCNEGNVLLPIESAVWIAQELCNGLDYAHRKCDERGRPLCIVHRDISPQNILISWEGEVKIVDFGIAKAAQRSFETEAGVIKGKFYYMSPEQARGEQVDQRSDLFSAGIVLYEMLTGTLLYRDEDDVTLLSRVRRADIQPPSLQRPEIPRELEKIVLKALARDPNRRYRNGREFADALQKFLITSALHYSKGRLAALIAQRFERASHHLAQTLPPTAPDGDGAMQREEYHAPASSMIHALDGDTSETPNPFISDSSRPTAPIQEALDADLAQSTQELSLDEAEEVVSIQYDPLEDEKTSVYQPSDDHYDLADLRYADEVKAAPAPTAEQPRVSSPAPAVAPVPEPAPERPEPASAVATAKAAPSQLGRGDEDETTEDLESHGMGKVPTEIGKLEELEGAAGLGQAAAGPAARQKLAYGALILPMLLSAWGVAYCNHTLALRARSGGTRVARTSSVAIAVATPVKARRASSKTTASPNLEIASNPAGAAVEVDGRELSRRTPTVLRDLEPGKTHHVVLTLKDHEAWEKTLKLRANETRSLSADLKRIMGSLEVRSTPSGATVSLDGQVRGQTPLTIEGLFIGDSPALSVRKDGYSTSTQQIEWAGRRAVELDLSLTATAAPAVVARPAPRPAPVRRAAAPSRAAPRQPQPAAAPAGDAYLFVHAIPWGKVYVDRRIYAPETPVVRGKIKAGRHSIKVYYPTLKRFSEPQTINLRAGEEKKLFFRD